jgi:hypothetical protein
MITAESAACSGSTSWLAVVIAVMGCVVGGMVGLMAAAYPPVDERGRRAIGTTLTVAGQAAVAASLVLDLSAVHTDRCGHSSGTAFDVTIWLFFGGLLALLFGAVVARATSWAPAAIVAVFDASFIGIFATTPVAHRLTLIAVLGTHGCCTSLAAWWSWQARGRDAVARAKASEAARILTAAWAIFAVLAAASAHEAGDSRLLSNSVFGSLFVIGAITVVTGTGFTKYIEAMDTSPPDELPRADGWMGRRRDWILRVTRTAPQRPTVHNESVLEPADGGRDVERRAGKPAAATTSEDTQPRKHEADRRYERKTVLLSALLAALVALIVAGASFGGLAWSNRHADHRDGQTFRRQQEAAAINTWFQAASAIDIAEINDATPAKSVASGAATSGSTELDIQTGVLKLAEETSALKLFVSTKTYNAAHQVAQMQANILNVVLDSKCADQVGTLPAECNSSKLATPTEISKAEDRVLALAQEDLK